MKKIIAFLLCLITVFSCLPLTVLCAEAQNNDSVQYKSLSETKIADDFPELDLSKYKPDKEKQNIEIISLYEQGYREDGDLSNYGLYIYIYNPSGKEIYKEGNKIELAGVLDFDNIWGANGYKYDLTYIDKTNNNCIYKFKIECSTQANLTKRRYNIVGVELCNETGYEKKDYRIGGTYEYTGYDYLAENGNTTLKCEVDSFETIELDLEYTTFRNTSELGEPYMNQLTSVYFAIPNYVLERYDSMLHGIDVEYEKYLTKPIVVIDMKNHSEAYNEIKRYEGKILPYDISLREYYSEGVPFTLVSGERIPAGVGFGAVAFKYKYSFSYNFLLPEFDASYIDSAKKVNCLPIVIGHPETITEDTYISKEEVSGHVKRVFTSAEYSSNFFALNLQSFNKFSDKRVGEYFNSLVFEDYLLNLDGQVSKWFHQQGNTISSAKVKASITMDDEKYNMESFGENHKWWERLYEYGFSRPKNDKDFLEIDPISHILLSDIEALSNSNISTKYLVEENEVDELKEYVKEKTEEEKTTYIFRISQDLYRSEPVYKDEELLEEVGFYAQEVVFMGFDVINLLFVDDGAIVSVPVVNSPKHIIPGLTAPPGINTDPEPDWWEKIQKFMKFAFFVILVVVLISFVPYGIKFINGTTGILSDTIHGVTNVGRKNNNYGKRRYNRGRRK